MKTSTTTPRTSRKSPSTAATKATPAAGKAATPRVRRAAPKKVAATKGTDPGDRVPSAEEVRFRAYVIYLGRNGQGDELSDWLQAEQELSAAAG